MLRRPRKSNPAQQAVGSGSSIPAPVAGWDASSPLANMKPDRAVMLENWFPEPGYVRIRRGFVRHAFGMPDAPVESLMPYHGVSSGDLFAACDDAIYDVTASGAVDSAVQSSLSNARWQHTNFTTSGGHFLWICNGADAARYYNGSTWANVSLSTADASDIVNVSAHKKRLWLTQNDSTEARYLGLEAVTGDDTGFEFGSLFTQGGYLMATATWTLDAGDGPDDYFVAISSRGQLAVYRGDDPSSLDTWALVGVFNLGAPIGRRCWTRVGGDLALISIDGVLPLSKAISFDRSAVERVTLTRSIENEMNIAARSFRDNFGWELMPYAKGTMAILNVPKVEGDQQEQFVMNTLSGAWCRFTGINANCWAVFNDRLFFGGNDGRVNEADMGGSDFGAAINAVGRTAYNYFNSRGQLKRWTMLQPLMTTDVETNPALGIATDFRDNAELATPEAVSTPKALWDSFVWDQGIWATTERVSTRWTAVNGLGQCAAIEFRSVSGTEGGSAGVWGFSEWGEGQWGLGNEGEVTVQINGFNVIYERGGFL